MRDFILVFYPGTSCQIEYCTSTPSISYILIEFSMRVYCVKSKFVCKYLPILDSIVKRTQSIEIEFSDTEVLISKVRKYCQCEAINENLTVLMSSDDEDVCNSIKKVCSVSYFKILLIKMNTIDSFKER